MTRHQSPLHKVRIVRKSLLVDRARRRAMPINGAEGAQFCHRAIPRLRDAIHLLPVAASTARSRSQSLAKSAG